MKSSAKLEIMNNKALRNKIVTLYNRLELTKNTYTANYEFMRPVDAFLLSKKEWLSIKNIKMVCFLLIFQKTKYIN